MYNSRCWGKSFDGYTGVTGFFNADYKAVHSDYTEYWHEGIDFRGNKDTQIKSLIYGQVVDFGTHTGNHNSGKGMGDYMIVQSLKDLNTYYLLVHLAYTSWNTYGIKKRYDHNSGNDCGRGGYAGMDSCLSPSCECNCLRRRGVSYLYK